MIQTSIIQDLVFWIEGHLEEPLNVKRVASKSGYSQWHLQRLKILPATHWPIISAKNVYKAQPQS